MSFSRRDFLVFMGSAIATTACQANLPKSGTPTGSTSSAFNPKLVNPKLVGVGFQPIQGPLPIATSGFPIAEQVAQLARYEVQDDLVLPEGYSYQIIGSWGDKIGNSRFGFNNDYLAFVETAPNEGFLTINFEYISAIPWIQNYQKVIGTALPIAPIEKALKANKDGIDAFSLPAESELKKQIQRVCKEALTDQGLGVISVKRNANGQWERTNAKTDRRITGISGLDGQNYLTCTGPAKQVFLKKSGQGYLDKIGDKLIGTFGNCAGGTTPWGTVLSGEENIQSQVPEAVYADGTSFAPKARTVTIDSEEVSGQGNVFGLAGNKYGWIVELDPANPDDYGTKHTWLGRYRHEAVGVRVVTGKPIAFYSGCDRRGGHLYKFVSKGTVTNPIDKTNSKLLADGMLYAAKFNADGTGEWIALKPETPVDPQLPSHQVGGMIPLPLRPVGGFEWVTDDQKIPKFKQKYKTLGDLYSGSPIEKQGAILIDAHYAANAAGATCTARPEDTEIAPDGSLYVAFTSGGSSNTDGGPDRRIFKGPQGETPYEYGFITHLVETDNAPEAMTFKWDMFSLGGEPNIGGSGFSNPDNLMIDKDQNIWVVCDTSSDKINRPARSLKNIAPSLPDRRGVFGNNGMWCIPSQGDHAGKAHLFAIGPMESELTGPYLSNDTKSLFLSVQHPGEINGTRQNMNFDTRTLDLQTAEGQSFSQLRQVPIGSNFPDRKPNSPTKPSVVVITRQDGKPIAG
jgi:uncharacterized protein